MWLRMSAIGALAYRSDGSSARVFFRLHRGNITSEETVAFLRHLRRHVRGSVVLIWDGLMAHRSRATRAYVERHSRWLRVERLPAYAPELNPVEALWAWLKHGRLANVADEGLGRLAQRVRRGIKCGRRRSSLLWAFLAKAGLSL